MGWFTKKPEPEKSELSPAELERAVDATIDAFMTNVCGYRNPQERTDDYGRRHFSKGSAKGMAWSQVDDDGDVFFHCAAYVMDLPSDRELLMPLYRELLEWNWQVTGGQRFAVLDNGLWVAYSEYARVMNASAIAFAIHQVMSLADALDDKLVEKYGGTTVARAV